MQPTIVPLEPRSSALSQSNQELMAGALGELAPESVFRSLLGALSDEDMTQLDWACNNVNADVKWFAVYEENQSPEEIVALGALLEQLASAIPGEKAGIAKKIAGELNK